MGKELKSLEQHLWALFDFWKKVAIEKDQMWYKQLFGQMRTLIADKAQKPKPLMLRLFDQYGHKPNVIINRNSPRPEKEIKFEEYLDEPFYGSKVGQMKKMKVYSLKDLIYNISNNDSTSHEKEMPEVLQAAQISRGDSRFDIQLFSHAAGRTIVCGVEFLKQLESDKVYECYRDWPMDKIQLIKNKYWG